MLTKLVLLHSCRRLVNVELSVLSFLVWSFLQLCTLFEFLIDHVYIRIMLLCSNLATLSWLFLCASLKGMKIVISVLASRHLFWALFFFLNFFEQALGAARVDYHLTEWLLNLLQFGWRRRLARLQKVNELFRVGWHEESLTLTWLFWRFLSATFNWGWHFKMRVWLF